MTGLTNSGQIFMLEQILTYFSSNNMYIGLSKETVDVLPSATLNNGITEINPTLEGTGSNYSRIQTTSWSRTVYNGNNVLMSNPVTFTVSGVWSSVNSYFICTESTGSNIIYTQPLPLQKQGSKQNNDTIIITAIYSLR